MDAWSLLATIHVSPFTLSFREFVERLFTGFFLQRERPIHTITLMFTLHDIHGRM